MTTQIPQMLLASIADLGRTHPTYFAGLDDTDLDTAPREEIVELMASAPNDQVKYFLLGALAMRMARAAITGRSS